MKTISLIQSDKYYSLMMIFNLEIFEWIHTYQALKRLVDNDVRAGGEVFKPIIYGKGQGKRYLIKGSTLKNILKKVKEGYTFK